MITTILKSYFALKEKPFFLCEQIEYNQGAVNIVGLDSTK